MVRENILRKFITSFLNEAVITGRKLDRYAGIIKREIINALKDDDLVEAFNSNGQIKFKLIKPNLLNDVEYLRDIIVSLTEDQQSIGADAAYEYTIGADPEERKTSDMIINLRFPRPFDVSFLDPIGVELIDTVRHELEHSGQPTEKLDDVREKVPDSEIWKTLKRAEAYYTSDSETEGHITGIVKRAKYQKKPFDEILDDELYGIYMVGKQTGSYTENELNDLMSKISDKWATYATSRYPKLKFSFKE